MIDRRHHFVALLLWQLPWILLVLIVNRLIYEHTFVKMVVKLVRQKDLGQDKIWDKVLVPTQDKTRKRQKIFLGLGQGQGQD